MAKLGTHYFSFTGTTTILGCSKRGTGRTPTAYPPWVTVSASLMLLHMLDCVVCCVVCLLCCVLSRVVCCACCDVCYVLSVGWSREEGGGREGGKKTKEDWTVGKEKQEPHS